MQGMMVKRFALYALSQSCLLKAPSPFPYAVIFTLLRDLLAPIPTAETRQALGPFGKTLEDGF